MEMELVDRGLCGITTECFVLRSKKKLPQPLDVRNRSTISYIGPALVGAKPFDKVKARDIDACIADKYSSKTAFIQDDYIYVSGKDISVKLLECVRVEGIFDNPADLEDYGTCKGCSTSQESHCFTLESTYPVPGHLVAPMTKEVLKSFILTDKLEKTRDTENNSVPE